MKKTYHLCWSGGNGVLFRSHQDFVRGINCLCLAAHMTGSSILAYAFMSNHVHICIRTESINSFIQKFRYPYTRYFNAKYNRKGALGEKDFFCLEVNGLYHLLTVIAYILRNPMHHGVTSTPFGYRYSSIRALFRKDMGWEDNCDILPEKSKHLHLPSHHTLPPHIKMDKYGMTLPEYVIDIADVEHQFSTARTFLYYMNRLTGEKWIAEQEEDHTSLPPITLQDIEKGVEYQDIRSMLVNEHGRANYSAPTDIEVCHKIDKELLPQFGKKSIYELSDKEKSDTRQLLERGLHISAAQISRCME